MEVTFWRSIHIETGTNCRTIHCVIMIIIISISFGGYNLFKHSWNDNESSRLQSPGFRQKGNSGDMLAAAAAADKNSCMSRYLSPLKPRRNPSPYLISKLRNYESRHRNCIRRYNETNPGIPPECKFIVSLTTAGLGNQVMSVTSEFLYALLTDRILLIHPSHNFHDLFCEPFPDTSWILPPELLLANKGSYLHIGNETQPFFCDQPQSELKNVSILAVRSTQYFAPSLFTIPGFEQELNAMFPVKDSVFHILSLYLYHPTNYVWGLVSRYYEAYLSEADVKVGIQIRTPKADTGTYFLKPVFDQMLSCIVNEGLLPKLNQQRTTDEKTRKNRTVIAVLMTSLNRGYYEELRTLFWENPTATGEIVQIHQPSFEEYQQTGDANHDAKALAEIYLLSLTDRLITTGMSTFGYVAQGLGGMRPWALMNVIKEDGSGGGGTAAANSTPCVKVKSMEPCFHEPPRYDCEANRLVERAELKKPYLMRCEDREDGIKLF